jgi:hypothetical protein
MEISREGMAQIAQGLTDNGRLIEAGWFGLRIASIPADAPQAQIDDMRDAFFAGAQHVFSSIIEMLDPEAEPTEADLARMSLIQAELDGFIDAFTAKHFPNGVQ